jgi:hypothetical protein
MYQMPQVHDIVQLVCIVGVHGRAQNAVAHDVRHLGGIHAPAPTDQRALI